MFHSCSLNFSHTPSSFTEKLKEVEDSTGYHKAYFFVLFVALLTGVLTLVGGIKLIVDLCGFVYPAYMSFKSMDAGSKDDTQWLTYWVVFSALSIFESVFSILTSFIPFYMYGKLLVIIWMYYPTTRGAETIYTQGIRPLLLPYLEKKAE